MSKLRWIFGENGTGERQFIIHLEPPRFIGEIFDDLDDPANAQNIKVIEWIDAPGHDASFLARLMREAGAALIEYDRLLGEDDLKE